MEYTIQVALEENRQFSAFLKQKIRDYNDQHSMCHREARKPGAVQPIHIIVSDDDNEWIGGLCAEVYWDWMEIHDFWLRDDCRGQGLGRRLLNQAEDIAKRKGASRALLTTFEFQARTFYEMHGYTVAGEIKDYPPGSSYYIMVKALL